MLPPALRKLSVLAALGAKPRDVGKVNQPSMTELSQVVSWNVGGGADSPRQSCDLLARASACDHGTARAAHG